MAWGKGTQGHCPVWNYSWQGWWHQRGDFGQGTRGYCPVWCCSQQALVGKLGALGLGTEMPSWWHHCVILSGTDLGKASRSQHGEQTTVIPSGRKRSPLRLPPYCLPCLGWRIGWAQQQRREAKVWVNYRRHILSLDKCHRSWVCWCCLFLKCNAAIAHRCRLGCWLTGSGTSCPLLVQYTCNYKVFLLDMYELQGCNWKQELIPYQHRFHLSH